MQIADLHQYLMAKRRPDTDKKVIAVREKMAEGSYVKPKKEVWISNKSAWIDKAASGGSFSFMYSTWSCIYFLNNKEPIVVLRNRKSDIKKFIYNKSSGANYLDDYAIKTPGQKSKTNKWDTALLSELVDEVLIKHPDEYYEEEKEAVLFFVNQKSVNINTNQQIRAIYNKIFSPLMENLTKELGIDNYLKYKDELQEFFGSIQAGDGFEYSLMRMQTFIEEKAETHFQIVSKVINKGIDAFLSLNLFRDFSKFSAKIVTKEIKGHTASLKKAVEASKKAVEVNNAEMEKAYSSVSSKYKAGKIDLDTAKTELKKVQDKYMALNDDLKATLERQKKITDIGVKNIAEYQSSLTFLEKYGIKESTFFKGGYGQIGAMHVEAKINQARKKTLAKIARKLGSITTTLLSNQGISLNLTTNIGKLDADLGKILRNLENFKGKTEGFYKDYTAKNKKHVKTTYSYNKKGQSTWK